MISKSGKEKVVIIPKSYDEDKAKSTKPSQVLVRFNDYGVS
ncbi:MAG: hypothetical protein P0116_02140 [Candidatus Nitrosocosmicus sp.]|nr:hypothetical protein [Candidatus Nitrosocosmicus sp.]